MPEPVVIPDELLAAFRLIRMCQIEDIFRIMGINFAVNQFFEAFPAFSLKIILHGFGTDNCSMPYFSCSVIAPVFLYLIVSIFALSSMENGMSSVRSTLKLSTATKRIPGLSSPVFR